MSEPIRRSSTLNSNSCREESIFIPFNFTDQLHLKRFCSNPNGAPVLMLHGTIENGKIFYSSSGKGLAPFLARNGFDVFVADLRGRGLSTPPISRRSSYGLMESIKEEIPAFIKKIQEIKGTVPLHMVGHSWGGVLMLCNYARYNQKLNIASMVFLGTKRRISIHSLRRFFMLEVVYGLFFNLISFMKGYVDSKMTGIGSDNETAKANRETFHWVTSKEWVDEDGFDYSKVLPSVKLPPALFIAGAHDKVLGHPKDVQSLMRETGEKQPHQFYLASKSNGNFHDYDHINLLTHPDAVKDHFPFILKWMYDHG